MKELIFYQGGIDLLRIRIIGKIVKFTSPLLNNIYMDIRVLPMDRNKKKKFDIMLNNIEKAKDEEEVSQIIIQEMKEDGFILREKNG